MPRKTYKDRIETLIAGGRLGVKDKRFAESMLAHYDRKKTLTPGRARAVRALESRYITNWQDPTSTELGQRLIALKSQDLSQWQKGFVESLEEQVSHGRQLSLKQLAYVSKFEGEFGPLAMKKKALWEKSFESDHRIDFEACMKYYSHAGTYYMAMVSSWKENSKYVPTEEKWTAMTNNKFTARIITENKKAQKYKNGELVQPRLRSRWAAKCGPKAEGFVVSYGHSTSACVGGRRVAILPVGSSVVYFAEERELKKLKM